MLRIIYIFIVCLLATGVSAADLPVQITIDTHQIIRPVTNQLLGFNDSWIHSNELAMIPGTDKINPKFIDALKGLPMPLNRMSGTDSQYFRWKWAVGPLAQRKGQGLAKWLQKRKVKYALGPLEWVRQTRLVDPKAKFDWVLNLRLDTPEDDAELAQLFTAGPDNKWGKLRYDYGIKKPIPISIWELGNEMGHTWHWSVDRYVKTCKKVIAAIRKVIPNAKFAAMAAQSPWGKKRWKGRDWRTWHRTVLKELGDKISYIVFHPYYDGLPIPKMEKYLNVIRDDIHTITGSRRIKIFLSEHSRWPPIKKRNLWYETHSLGGCLSTATFINRLLQRPQVTAACYHCLSGGPWGVIYQDKKTGKFWTTGIYDLFKLLNDSLGKNVVSTKVSGVRTDVTNSDMTFTATAMTRADGGLNLLLVNRELKDARTITFHTQNKYRISEELILTGPSIHTHNTAGKDVLNIQRRAINKALTHFKIPPRSIVVLKCRY